MKQNKEDSKHALGAGMQQGLKFSDILDIPFVFSSNGDGFIFHDKTVESNIEKELTLDQFPSSKPKRFLFSFHNVINSAAI